MKNDFRPNPKPEKTGKKTKKAIRSRGKNWKPATKEELDHLAWIKSECCEACGSFPPVEAHHLVEGKRLGHYYTLPLCVYCHRLGDYSIQRAGRKGFAKHFKKTDFEMFEDFIQKHFTYFENKL